MTQELLELTRELADKELRPAVDAAEQAGTFPRETFRLLGRAAASWQRNQHGENEVEFGLTHLFLSRSGFFPIAGFGLRVFAERFDPPSHRMLIPPRNHVKGRTLGLWMSE